MKYLDALRKAKSMGKQVVIPDIKVFSPKDGELMRGRTPAEYARALVEAGAPVLSCVTEEKDFHGSLDMLRSITSVVDVPVLRKDFIHSKEDLIATKEAGASAILLMCSCLEPDELRFLYQEALNLGLDPFVETHREEDFAIVQELQAKLVGINNRDILKLERDDGDVNHTLGLAQFAPKGAFLVTESSIKNPEEVRMAIRSGADAALVGTAIAIAPDPVTYYKMLTTKTSMKICGLMNTGDVSICVESGVERIGFVVDYPLDVPWNLSVEKAKIVRGAIPKGFAACMVTGGSPEKILKLATEIKPDYVQLHYKETLEETAAIASELRRYGISVIKTLPVGEESCIQQFRCTDLKKIVSDISETEVAEILVDPRHGDAVAMKNLKADEDLFAVIKEYSSKPVILAGGLKPENLKSTLKRTGALAVDIMNGSEDAPGKKNREKIQELASIIRE